MKISVIVPTLEEADRLDETLVAARACAEGAELIVVDGGSRDETTEVARRHGALVLQATSSRAGQMNQGAAEAAGEVLLFLHADTRLPRDAGALVEQALRDPAVAGGCFRLEFDSRSFALRPLAYLTRFDFPLLHFGDQAFFVRARAFRDLEGYRPWPLMEDLDLWLRLRRRGRLVVIQEPVVTSARRFLRTGVIRQQLKNGLIVLLFLLGVSPGTLKKLYGGTR
jgi:rSAM/selenodomain-associated transferase 2